jgi:hypothetical protein
MFRDSMTGDSALAIFEAMLMIFGNLLAEAGAKIGHVPGWRARQHHPFQQADDAPAAPGRRQGWLREFRPPPALRPYIRLRPDEPRLEAGRPVIPATPILM